VNADEARRWVVEGRVQGVGFRWFVLRTAQALGVTGWARNCADGSVEVVARGGPEALRRLGESLRRGPPGAFVHRITSSDVPHQDVEANSFNIKR
jgi:acylphosphatase